MSTPKIIVIEDQQGVQNVYASYLANYYTYLYSTATDALRDIKEIKPDLIITDLKLPDMYGLEFIRILRKEMKITAPLIIVSGAVDMAASVKAVEWNVSEILVKPVSQKELLASVERHLMTRKL